MFLQNLVLDPFSVLILSPGTYKITFMVNILSSGAVALTINGLVKPENTYKSNASNQQCIGFLILSLQFGDIIGLRHVNDSNAVTLTDNINASLLMESLNIT